MLLHGLGAEIRGFALSPNVDSLYQIIKEKNQTIVQVTV
jgi:hypothetical protein